jgi:hypothetical protein
LHDRQELHEDATSPEGGEMKDNTDNMETKRDLASAVGQIRRDHPSLPERLGQYRDKRATYEAKRMSVGRPAAAPARQGARRELRG